MNKTASNFTFLLLDYFRDNKKYYIYFILISIFGLIMGVYLSLMNFEFVDILKSDDQILLESIRGESGFFGIFGDKLLDCLFVILLLFVFNLSIYICFLSYLFILYQNFLFGATCVALVSQYSFRGVICTILVVPINILLLFAMISFAIVCYARAKNAHRYNLKFFNSFSYYKLPAKFGLCLILFICVCLLYALVFGLLLESFVFGVF